MARSIKNLVAAVLVAISFYLLWVVVYPKYNVTNVLKDTIDHKTAVVAARTEISEKIKNIQEEYENRFTELERFSLVIPLDKKIPELVSAVAEIAQFSGNLMNSFRVSEGQSFEGQGFTTITFDATLEGTYPSLLALLRNFEQHIRLTDITNVTIGESNQQEEDREEDQGGVSPRLNFQIRGNAYFINKETSR